MRWPTSCQRGNPASDLRRTRPAGQFKRLIATGGPSCARGRDLLVAATTSTRSCGVLACCVRAERSWRPQGPGYSNRSVRFSPSLGMAQAHPGRCALLWSLLPSKAEKAVAAMFNASVFPWTSSTRAPRTCCVTTSGYGRDARGCQSVTSYA